jgi:hypothetical protein
VDSANLRLQTSRGCEERTELERDRGPSRRQQVTRARSAERALPQAVEAACGRAAPHGADVSGPSSAFGTTSAACGRAAPLRGSFRFRASFRPEPPGLASSIPFELPFSALEPLSLVFEPPASFVLKLSLELVPDEGRLAAPLGGRSRRPGTQQRSASGVSEREAERVLKPFEELSDQPAGQAQHRLVEELLEGYPVVEVWSQPAASIRWLIGKDAFERYPRAKLLPTRLLALDDAASRDGAAAVRHRPSDEEARAGMPALERKLPALQCKVEALRAANDERESSIAELRQTSLPKEA